MREAPSFEKSEVAFLHRDCRLHPVGALGEVAPLTSNDLSNVTASLLCLGTLQVGTAAGAPDLNHDGTPEQIATPTALSRADQSSVLIRDGATGAAIRRISLGDPDDALGWSACRIGDADADGVPDNLVQAFRARMDTGCTIDLSKNLVTVSQIYKVMDDLWQDVPKGE